MRKSKEKPSACPSGRSGHLVERSVSFDDMNDKISSKNITAIIPEAPAGYFINSGGYQAQTILSHRVWEPNTSYSLDWGQPLYDNNRWKVMYGMVSDKSNVFSCDINGYSEDIWLTAGDENGFHFANTAGDLLITSLDMVPHFGQGEMRTDSVNPCKDDPRCSGYNIGEPSVVKGSQHWYVFFDSQTCLQAQNNQQFGIIVAVSQSLNSGWSIRKRLDDTAIPGVRPLRFPRTFKDPKTNLIWIYYQDAALDTYAIKMNDDGSGFNFDSASLLAPPIIKKSTNIFSVAYDPKSDSYFATADNFGTGQYHDLNTIWLLGPAQSPTDFNWSNKVSLLKNGDWFSGHVRSPYLMIDHRGKSRMYFWGKNLGGHDSSDSDDRSVKMGLAYDFPLATNIADFHLSGSDGQSFFINYSLPLNELNQNTKLFLILQTSDNELYYFNGKTRKFETYISPEKTTPAIAVNEVSGRLDLDINSLKAIPGTVIGAYAGYGQDLNQVISTNQFQLIWSETK